MATSDSPLSVPDVTLAVARGAGSGGGSEPGSDPIISSFSGTFGQGNTITLNGSFSAERDGMVAYLQGDPNSLGASPPELVDFDGNPGSFYVHSTERAFGKSGASLKAAWPGDSTYANIRLPQRSRKLFLSAEVFMNLESWNTDPDGASPQVKFMRLLSESGVHNDTTPTQHIQVDAVSGGFSRWRLDYPNTTFQGEFEDESGNRLRFDPPGLTGWYRFVLYGEVSTSETSGDGRIFAHCIRHSDNSIWPADRGYTDGGPALHPRRSYFAPAVHNFPLGAPSVNTWLAAMLPFFRINIDALEVFVDLVGVNDTPERVELGNNPIMDDCTKLILQKQVSRNVSEINFEVEEGNFSASDDIYAFVVNGDTSYSAGKLIRAGS